MPAHRRHHSGTGAAIPPAAPPASPPPDADPVAEAHERESAAKAATRAAEAEARAEKSDAENVVLKRRVEELEKANAELEARVPPPDTTDPFDSGAVLKWSAKGYKEDPADSVCRTFQTREDYQAAVHEDGDDWFDSHYEAGRNRPGA